MASSTGRRVRPEALVGIVVGVVALTAVGAVAVGLPRGDDERSGDHPKGLQHPRGQEQAEWARDHTGPPPWSHGRGKDKDGDGWKQKDKHEKPEKHEKKDKDRTD